VRVAPKESQKPPVVYVSVYAPLLAKRLISFSENQEEYQEIEYCIPIVPKTTEGKVFPRMNSWIDAMI
jgi:hypothetical protein